MSEVDMDDGHDDAGIWKPGAWGDNDDAGETSTAVAAPFPRYVPMYDDSIEKRIAINVKSSDYEKFFTYESKMLAGLIEVGTIKFDIELERVKTDHDEHKDLIVHVVCHREGLDPIWRCSYQCEINASFGDVNATVTGQKKDANNKDNSLTMPVMRLPSEPVNTAYIDVNIKMTKWKGINPRMKVDFTKPHEYSNATLIVEGSPLYVNREILAIHSLYFYAMFFNKGFADAAKTEFTFPDVSYEDMVLFLNLCYPETMVGKRESHIKSIDVLERVLHLSEQFVAGSLKNIAESMLKGAPSRHHFHRTSWTRILYIADRFRLSDACTAMMRRLNSESDFITLRQSEEFELLSSRLRSSLLKAALDKLPSSTFTRKKRMPSRTGRIGTFSDVEVDDDDDDSDDVAVIGTVNPSPSAATAPGITRITPASFPQSLHGFTGLWANIPPNGIQPATSSSASAAVAAGSSSSTAAATVVSTSAAATSSATFAPASTAAVIPAAPARIRTNSNTRASSKHVNFASPVMANSSSFDQRTSIEAFGPSLFRAYGFSNVKPDKDIKEEVVSEDEMGEDDDAPGPSNRAAKRTIKSASGVTTRSRSKRPKKS